MTKLRFVFLEITRDVCSFLYKRMHSSVQNKLLFCTKEYIVLYNIAPNSGMKNKKADRSWDNFPPDLYEKLPSLPHYAFCNWATYSLL